MIDMASIARLAWSYPRIIVQYTKKQELFAQPPHIRKSSAVFGGEVNLFG